MQLDTFDQKGKKLTTKVDVADDVFASKVNESLLAQYLYVYLSNQRQSNASTKDRSEVRGGGKKPYKQKGTGRARAGSTRSPIWTKGGVTFGPTSDRNYKKAINKKARKAAYRSIFSKLVKTDSLNLIDSVKFSAEKLTKQAEDMVNGFKSNKVTLVISGRDENVINAFSNLADARVCNIAEVSIYDLMVGGKVLMTADCLEYINAKWSKPAKEKPTKVAPVAKSKKTTKSK